MTEVVPDATNSVPIRRGVFINANDRYCQVVNLGDIQNVGVDVTGIMIQRTGHDPQRLLMSPKMFDMLLEAMLRYRGQPDVEGTQEHYAIDESVYDGDRRIEC